MSLLKVAPSGVVRSMEELFAIAQAMEHEAATRYAELSDQVRAHGMPELGQLFEHLAAEERAHESDVLQWAQQRSGKAPDPADIRWELPETFDEETAAELAASRLANAYRILSMAVRNEERAFAFWSYVAAEAGTPEVRKAAERMAHEELGHVALLRRARRQAYHAERRDHPMERVRSAVGRLAEAGVLECRLADEMDTLSTRMSGDDAKRAQELAAQSRTMADEVARVAPEGKGRVVQDLDMLAMAERLVENYLDAGDLSRDEEIVAAAQVLAKRAIVRLAWLRMLIADQPM